jgi:predicted DNA-binding protein
VLYIIQHIKRIVLQEVRTVKTLLSEKRTQVYFPKEVYRRIEKKAKKESKSSAAVIREAVERYLEEERDIDWENDPIFKLAGIGASGLGDLAVNHDKYLYGDRERKKR